jgi:hypothetical protein
MNIIPFAKPIRHSSLPKLAECPCFEGKPGEAGPAAARGTLLDLAMRELLAGGEMPAGVTGEDAAAVEWAVAAVEELADGAKIFSADADCKVTTPGMEHLGTADAIIPDRLLVVDLKSGKVRNYREQVAAYALGLMEEYFAGRWTCVLLFCDARRMVVHEFSYEEAAELVGGILKAASDPAKKPVLCDYCNWCAHSTSCPARVEAVEQTLELASIVEPLNEDQREWVLESLLEDREGTARFLAQVRVLEAFREKVEDRVKELLTEDAEAVPGWKLRAGGTSEVVFADDLKRMVTSGMLSVGGVLEAVGNMSGRKFRELWSREMVTSEVPAVIRQGAQRAPSLVAVKAKKPQGGV